MTIDAYQKDKSSQLTAKIEKAVLEKMRLTPLMSVEGEGKGISALLEQWSTLNSLGDETAAGGKWLTMHIGQIPFGGYNIANHTVFKFIFEKRYLVDKWSRVLGNTDLIISTDRSVMVLPKFDYGTGSTSRKSSDNNPGEDFIGT